LAGKNPDAQRDLQRRRRTLLQTPPAAGQERYLARHAALPTNADTGIDNFQAAAPAPAAAVGNPTTYPSPAAGPTTFQVVFEAAPPAADAPALAQAPGLGMGPTAAQGPARWLVLASDSEERAEAQIGASPSPPPRTI